MFRRKREFTRFVLALADGHMLDKIADVMQVTKIADIKAQQNAILVEMNDRVKSNKDMDALGIRLRMVTEKDF